MGSGLTGPSVHYAALQHDLDYSLAVGHVGPENCNGSRPKEMQSRLYKTLSGKSPESLWDRS